MQDARRRHNTRWHGSTGPGGFQHHGDTRGAGAHSKPRGSDRGAGFGRGSVSTTRCQRSDVGLREEGLEARRRLLLLSGGINVEA